MGSNPIGGTVLDLLAPLAADRALEPAYFVVTRGTKERVPSLLVSTAARDPGLNCSLRVRLLAPLAEDCAWKPLPSSLAPRQRSVVARRRKSVVCSLRLHCSLRSLRLALGSRCLPHSLADGEALSALSLVQAATRNPARADRALDSAYFVVARNR
jgi:hypothetical protein